MSTATKPIEAIQTAMAGLSGISALGGRVFQGTPEDHQGFPLLCWHFNESPGPTDAESWLYRDYKITVDLFGGDEDQLEDLKLSVDLGLGDLCHGGGMDSSEWRITRLRREVGWRKIAWNARQDTTGNAVIQWQSEWRFTALRKQS
jgi:hypothetical protein